MRQTAERLADYCRERVGEGLRGVARYGPDGDEMIYLRRDVAAATDQTALRSTMEQARLFHETVESAGELQPTLGTPEASVNVFNDAIVMHLYRPGPSGVILTFERSVGRELTSFVAQLLDILHEEMED